ncbi:MAG: amidase [Actinobacteria bacterium]|nr:MAG: amidase [Actinomycetota bacterium]
MSSPSQASRPRRSRKKIIFTVLGSILALLLVLGVGGWFYLRSILPADEERIAYGSDDVIFTIDAQLEGIDREKLDSLAPLILGKSSDELQAQVAAGNITYTDITAFFLHRIATLDQGPEGINSFITVNPKALEYARRADSEAGVGASPATDRHKGMYGLPIAVKDNINTSFLPTSAGTLALKDFMPREDAPVITHLLDHGAIIIGKANLSELANYVDSHMPSGYSTVKGQTMNPIAPLKLSPLGSSSGSAAATSAGFAVAALGTETAGSIVAPASIQSVVGFKPTHDRISGEGAVPLVPALDTIGPIALTVSDAAALFNASTTAEKSIALPTDTQILKGKRIGTVNGSTTDPAIIAALEEAGATIVPVDLEISDYDGFGILSTNFGPALNEYLTKYQAHVSSLQELVNFKNEDPERRARYGQGYLEEAATVTEGNSELLDKEQKRATDSLNAAFSTHKLDALVGNANDLALLASMTGAPEITVPATSGEGGPVGATFVALPSQDEQVVAFGYAFEHKVQGRIIPDIAKK